MCIRDRVGTDGFGDTLRNGLMADGIDVRHVNQSDSVGTGVAMILVDDIGQNRIVLAAGANGTLSTSAIDEAGDLIDGAALLVVQLEVPLAVVLHAMRRAHAAGVPVLLNPAPAVVLPDEIWPLVDILVPNESEAALLTGLSVTDADSAHSACLLYTSRCV